MRFGTLNPRGRAHLSNVASAPLFAMVIINGLPWAFSYGAGVDSAECDSLGGQVAYAPNGVRIYGQCLLKFLIEFANSIIPGHTSPNLRHTHTAK
jgi:hypothetical protein